jgi:RNA polymerase sigma-70 factor (ECF subfamily)
MTATDALDRAERDKDWALLMGRAQDGDRAAYERLLREIHPLICRIVARDHRAQDRVEDVAQDVLLTIHRIRHTYDPARPFGPWLAAIARRRSIDLLRRRGRSDAKEIFDELAYETYSDPGANREQETRHEADGLAEAIATLPEGQREAVELLKLRELSLIEAAAITGRSVGALKVNMHRALLALRARLRGQ